MFSNNFVDTILDGPFATFAMDCARICYLCFIPCTYRVTDHVNTYLDQAPLCQYMPELCMLSIQMI